MPAEVIQEFFQIGIGLLEADQIFALLQFAHVKYIAKGIEAILEVFVVLIEGDRHFFFDGYAVLQLVGGTAGDAAAGVHDDDAVTEVLCFLEIMCCVNYGRTVIAQGLDIVEQELPALSIHRHCRLVEEDQFRPVHDAAGDIEPALETAGELLGQKFAVFIDIDIFDSAIDILAAPGLVVDIEATEVVDILVDSEIREVGQLLRHDADPGFEIITIRVQLFAEDLDLAALVFEQREDRVDHRGLAGAVRPEQAQDLPLCYLEIKIIHCDEVAVFFRQAIYFNYHVDISLCRLLCRTVLIITTAFPP